MFGVALSYLLIYLNVSGSQVISVDYYFWVTSGLIVISDPSIIYESFSTRFDTNLWPTIGEGATLVRPHPGPFVNCSQGAPAGDSPATPDQLKIRSAAVS